ncbi:MAG TPA: aldehyde dehydrogenase family protein, partial [Blastocatellia bacterium]|nr:aldehyde dehydrogenase family protein [Blastocatellia bacterium]
MKVFDKLYIGGKWIESTGNGTLDVTDSSTEAIIARIPNGTVADIDAAVTAAHSAFEPWSKRSPAERAGYLTKIAEGLVARKDEIAETIAAEVGMPLPLAIAIQAGLPAAEIGIAAELAVEYPFEEKAGTSVVVREPVGVVGCITPWNYPLHQVTAKVGPALAAGCSVVLKPSELAPITAFFFAEIIDSVRLPAGVFNLVTGLGPVVGEALAFHPLVDMISFTGSTRAGKRVSELAA